MVMSQALKEEMVYLEFLVGIWVELSCLVHCFIPLTFYFLFIQYVLFPAVHDKYPRNKLRYTMCSHLVPYVESFGEIVQKHIL